MYGGKTDLRGRIIERYDFDPLITLSSRLLSTKRYNEELMTEDEFEELNDMLTQLGIDILYAHIENIDAECTSALDEVAYYRDGSTLEFVFDDAEFETDGTGWMQDSTWEDPGDADYELETYGREDADGAKADIQQIINSFNEEYNFDFEIDDFCIIPDGCGIFDNTDALEQMDAV